MPQKLPVAGFKWEEDLSQFNKNFIRNHDENSYKCYILKLEVEYLKNSLALTMIFHFYPKERK